MAVGERIHLHAHEIGQCQPKVGVERAALHPNESALLDLTLRAAGQDQTPLPPPTPSRGPPVQVKVRQDAESALHLGQWMTSRVSCLSCAFVLASLMFPMLTGSTKVSCQDGDLCGNQAVRRV